MELRDGVETVSRSGTRMGRPWIVAEGRKEVRDSMVFPNVLTSLQPDYLLVYRVMPLGAERTAMVCEVWVHAGCTGDGAIIDDVTNFWDEVHREDAMACERQQRSVRSRAWRWDRYGDGDDGLHAFDRGIASRLLSALDLRAAAAAAAVEW